MHNPLFLLESLLDETSWLKLVHIWPNTLICLIRQVFLSNTAHILSCEEKAESSIVVKHCVFSVFTQISYLLVDLTVWQFYKWSQKYITFINRLLYCGLERELCLLKWEWWIANFLTQFLNIIKLPINCTVWGVDMFRIDGSQLLLFLTLNETVSHVESAEDDLQLLIC